MAFPLRCGHLLLLLCDLLSLLIGQKKHYNLILSIKGIQNEKRVWDHGSHELIFLVFWKKKTKQDSEYVTMNTKMR